MPKHAPQQKTSSPRAARPPPPGPALASAASLRFVAVFGLASLALLAAYHFPYPDGSFPLQLMGLHLRAYARVSGALIGLFDAGASVDGTLISGRFPLRIVRSCDAGEAMALLVAAMLAFPATPRQRVAGAALALPILYGVNVLRIGTLYLIGVSHRELFDVAHLEVWPVAIILVATLLFVAWARWLQGEGGRGAPRST